MKAHWYIVCSVIIYFDMPQSIVTYREVAVATNLVVRNVDEDVVLALKQLAASHGRSTEAEHREILKSVLRRPKRRSAAEVLSSMPNVGEDADFNEIRSEQPFKTISTT